MGNPPEPPVLLRVCPSCNRQIEIDHTYCEICGAMMPELPACRNCGAQFIAPVKFCERCGTPVLPHTNPEQADGEIPKPDERLLPVSKKSGVPKKAPVPASTGPDLSATVDDALFFLSDDKPVPVQPKVDRLYRTGGIVFITILLAGVLFIGLPMLAGGGGTDVRGTPAAAEVTSVPYATTVPATRPTLTGTGIPVPVSDALVPKPTQLVPEGQDVSFLVQKDPVTARITVTLAGGPGIDSISSSEVKVTRPDGAVASAVILPFKGSVEVVLDGSKETDRVEIIAKMAGGRTYRVYDDLVPFRR